MTRGSQWKVWAGNIYCGVARLHWHMRSMNSPKSLPILVIGSLRGGGGGKTPVVEWIARRCPDVAILVHPTQDEQVLLERQFPGRVFAHSSFPKAWKAANRNGFSWALCDGGFQDPRLALCRKILLWNEPLPQNPANLHPFGPWRELAAAANRADLHLVREGVTPPQSADHMTYRWQVDVEDLSPGRVLLACGVGRPKSVRDDLAGLGFEVVAEHCVRDHGRFSERRLKQLERQYPGLPWIGTGKDLPRWPQEMTDLHPLRREWIPEDSKALLAWVEQWLLSQGVNQV